MIVMTFSLQTLRDGIDDIGDIHVLSDNLLNLARKEIEKSNPYSGKQKQGEQKPIEQDTEIRDLWVYIREWNEKFGRLPKDEDELAACIDYVMKRQKPADKVESKFKIEKDKWYICIRDLDDNYGTRAFCKGCTYHSTKDETLIPDNSNIPFEIKYCVNDYFRLWTIQDANDGDVLSIRNPFIFRGFGDKRHPNSPTAYCGINSSGTFILSWENDWWTADDAHPATKEQHDILFQKMKEAGYEWDAEKKELKKISAQSSWSEEDEKELGAIIDELKRYVMFKQYGTPLSVYDISWLEELPSRFIIQQQPKQEWSKEDKSFIEDITNVIIENYNILQSDKEKMIDWLKSIKPQNRWKPS